MSVKGTAYCVFSVTYGAGMLASGVVYGLLMDLKLPLIMVAFYVIAAQAIAITLLRVMVLRPQLLLEQD